MLRALRLLSGAPRLAQRIGRAICPKRSAGGNSLFLKKNSFSASDCCVVSRTGASRSPTSPQGGDSEPAVRAAGRAESRPRGSPPDRFRDGFRIRAERSSAWDIWIFLTFHGCLSLTHEITHKPLRCAQATGPAG